MHYIAPVDSCSPHVSPQILTVFFFRHWILGFCNLKVFYVQLSPNWLLIFHGYLHSGMLCSIGKELHGYTT